MNSHVFRFTHTVGDIALDCLANYWSDKNEKPEKAGLLDVSHQGVSILEIIEPTIVTLIDQEAIRQAIESWAGSRADAQDDRLAA
jgi:hypothetical protein